MKLAPGNSCFVASRRLPQPGQPNLTFPTLQPSYGRYGNSVLHYNHEGFPDALGSNDQQFCLVMYKQLKPAALQNLLLTPHGTYAFLT